LCTATRDRESNHGRRKKANAAAAAEAPAKIAETVADTATKVAKDSAAAQKRARASAARKSRRDAAKAEGRFEDHSYHPRQGRQAGPRKAARKVAAATEQRIQDVTNTTNKFFAGFDSVPAFAPFQSLFSDAGERGQDVVRRTQKVAEEMADLTRANVEALVESGRVAAEGVRSLGQDVVPAAATASKRLRTRSAPSPKPSRRPNICSCRARLPAPRSTAWSQRARAGRNRS
jgi:hypothetical protein